MTQSPPADWLAQRLRDRRPARLRPVAPHDRGRGAAPGRLRARSGASSSPSPTNPVDAVWDDQPPPPRGPDRPARPRATPAGRSPDKRREIADDPRRGRRRRRGPHRSRLDRLAPERPRRRRRPHAPSARLRASSTATRPSTSSWTRPSSARGSPSTSAATVRVPRPTPLGPALDRLGAAGGRCRSTPARRRPGSPAPRPRPARRSCAAPTPASSPRRARTPWSWPGPGRAHQRDGTALCRFLAWLAARRRRVGLTEVSGRRPAGRLPGARSEPLPGAELPHDLGRRPQRRDRPLPGDAAHRPAPRARASCTWSIPAASTSTAPPTSPAPWRSARRPPSSGTASPACSRATSRSPWRASRRGPAAPSSTPSPGRPLWEAGLDYDHGTGHGVGSYLGVHEGPQRISKARRHVALLARDDRVQRARLLQDRRLRDPHREPGRGDAAPVPGADGEVTLWASRR